MLLSKSGAMNKNTFIAINNYETAVENKRNKSILDEMSTLYRSELYECVKLRVRSQVLAQLSPVALGVCVYITGVTRQWSSEPRAASVDRGSDRVSSQ